jgi:hypothetical protein
LSIAEAGATVSVSPGFYDWPERLATGYVAWHRVAICEKSQNGVSSTLPEGCTVSPVIRDLAIGAGHSCAVYESGQLSCVGGGSRYPNIKSITGVLAVDSQDTFTCALKSDARVSCWSGRSPYDVEAFEVPGLSNAIEIAVGRDHACALTTDGHVFCWGSNSNGQLGINLGYQVTYSANPVAVPNLNEVVAISAGTGHSCALLATGSLKCWGESNRGQIGSRAASGATLVPGITNGVDVDAMGDRTRVLLADGTVYEWGDLYSGPFTFSPTQMIGVSGVTTAEDGCLDGPFVDLICVGPLPENFISDRVSKSYSNSGTTCVMMPGSDVQCYGANYNYKTGQKPGMGYSAYMPMEGLVATVPSDASGKHLIVEIVQERYNRAGTISMWSASVLVD